MISENYYNKNAAEFFENTSRVNMEEICNEFMQYLKNGDKILDVGCGSGRDMLFFKGKGFNVEGIDTSEELIKLARNFTGEKITQLDMREINFEDEYNGIWACASLLHLERDEIEDVVFRCFKALKNNGVFYMSFKYGDFEGVRNGRYFTDLNEEIMSIVLGKLVGIEIVNMWKTVDKREDRPLEYWLNIIVRKYWV